MKELILNIGSKSNLKRSFDRHLYFFLKYLSFKKFYNLCIAFIEFKLKIANCKSFPAYLRFETSSVCNLRCAGCAIGGATNKSIAQNSNAFVSFDNFKKNIADFLPYLLKVNLYDEGEPLLNKEIYKIISYLNSQNVCSCISTNFSIKFSENDLKNLVESKLDHLIIALDGYDQESYSKYRIGGDFQLVMQNLSNLQKLITQYNSPMKIETQYIEFPDSDIETREKVKDLASSLNVWRHTVIEKGSREGWEGYYFKGTPDQRRELGCYYIWFSGSILTNGEYYCCDFGEDTGMEVIGNAADFKTKNLHNNEFTKNIRKSFKKGELNKICAICPQTSKKI